MKYLSIFVSALIRFAKRIVHAIFFPFENMIAVRSSLRVEIIRAKTRKLSFGEWTGEMLNLLFRGNRHDYGVVSRNKVTTKGVEYIGKWLANTYSGAAYLMYHEWGSSNAEEDVTLDKAGCRTKASPTSEDGTYASGTHTGAVVGAHYVYTSEATIVADEAASIYEHAIHFGNDTTITEDCFDRSKWTTAYVLQIGDSIKFTYQLTLNSGA